MSIKTNTKVIFKQVPKTNCPDISTDFEIRRDTIDIGRNELKSSEILVRTLYVGLDPFLRGTLVAPSAKTTFTPQQIGQPIFGGVIAEVVQTKNPKYAVGDIIIGFSSWTEYAVIDAENPKTTIKKIPKGRESPFPISYYMGLFGIPGLTAYVGLHKVCEPFIPGQTLYVSAAAGAVGQVVGQYGKALGMRVVGSAGDDKKVNFLIKELGFDAAFNYKNHTDFDTILKETCPNGIDIYFENVGGKMLDAVLLNCNINARIVGSGMISQYAKPEPIHNIAQIISKRIKFQGIITLDDMPKYFNDAIETFSKLLKEGKIQYKEDITKGIENLPHAFLGMLQGKNFGRAVVQVAEL